MTEQNPYPSHPPAPPAQPPRPANRNGLGTAGFVLGLIGLIFSVIPVVGVIAWPLVILGLIFGILGVLRVNKGEASNKGLAIAAVVVSAVGLVICILWVAAFGKAANDVQEEANRSVTVHYEVTGTASNVTVTYSTFGDGNSSMNQEEVANLPWSKDVETKGLFKGGSLTVTTGADGGKVTCTVVVDGEESTTSTAKGQFSTASCDGFSG
ncbi:MmpS family transport accessory protein [Haloechinothrix salitolerans]|uniref:MmpS family transport accessory protein n=1 Tax=Haloechinothrix salitolerans TaxID=926830 RepID=A0ABW2C4U7_9PSEU